MWTKNLWFVDSRAAAWVEFMPRDDPKLSRINSKIEIDSVSMPWRAFLDVGAF
jgi:hypothetical protein